MYVCSSYLITVFQVSKYSYFLFAKIHNFFYFVNVDVVFVLWTYAMDKYKRENIKKKRIKYV
jgi:hypothetical protein